jgi:hypothetical protein
MTTNLKRWLQAVLVFALLRTAIWQISSAIHGKGLVWPHLVIAICLTVPASLLIFGYAIGSIDEMLCRLMVVTSFGSFLWYGLKSVNTFVLQRYVETADLIRTIGCGFLFVIFLIFEGILNGRETEPDGVCEAPAPLPLAEPLPTERGFYYPD